MDGRILIIGANGQIGTELALELRSKHGTDMVIATDIKEANPILKESGPYFNLDVLDKDAIYTFLKKHDIKYVYQLAAFLSATAEQHLKMAWKLNMEGLFNILDAAEDLKLTSVFWPSSIAAFGPNSPKISTPQYTIMDPNTVYGISKLAGEGWCEYYHQKRGVDVRSLRYPGLISYKSPPGGGTTDYAVEIFHAALKGEKYTCFLEKDMRLPMMYMEDAIRGTIELMEAPSDRIKIRTSYNISAIDFTPEEIAHEIQKHIPKFEIEYKPDFRQAIASSWPRSINDTDARKDWNWSEQFNMSHMVETMLNNIKI